MKRASLIIAVVSAVVLLGVGTYVTRALYFQPQDRPWIRGLVTTFPVPIARVDRQRVKYADYFVQQDATRAFLRSPVARLEGLPTDIDAQANVSLLNQLLRVAAVQEMARVADLQLRAGEVDRMYADILNRAGTSTEPGEVAAYLQSTFGWTEDAFKERVVRPAALETVVRQEVYKGDEAAFENAVEEKISKAVKYIRL